MPDEPEHDRYDAGDDEASQRLIKRTLGNGLASRFSRLVKRPSRVLVLTTTTTALAILVGGAVPALLTPGSPANFAVALLAFWMTMLMFGINSPVRQGLINDLIDADERATVLSVDSLISNLGSTVGIIALGWYAQQVSDAGGLGIGKAWIVGAGVILLAVPLLLMVGGASGRRRGDPGEDDDRGAREVSGLL